MEEKKGQEEVPIVSSAVDEVLKYKIKLEALEKCKPEIEKYVSCTKGRTLSLAWACKEQLYTLKRCTGQLFVSTVSPHLSFSTTKTLFLFYQVLRC